MASKHVLRFSAIMDFFKEEKKLVSRGENAVESNHVKEMAFDEQLKLIRGTIHASMRDRVYKVELKLDNDNDIEDATCTCPRGQLMCHHMAALAIFSYHNISVTDVSCSWSSKKSNDTIKTIRKLFPAKKHTSTSETLNSSQLENFKTKLQMFGNAVGFTWLLRDEPTVLKDIVDVEEIIFSEQYLTEENKVLYLQNCLELTTEKINEVAKNTIGQSSNEKWLRARKNRLTSSNFGVILSAMRNNRFPKSLFKRLTESYTLDGIKAIQWGRLHEADGIALFEKNRETKVEPTGLWLDQCGFIGCSPDGLLHDDAIIEIKCPYKLRQSSSLMNDLRDKTYILFINENGEIILNKHHQYYHQMQGNLHITKRKVCYLVIWTPSESIIYDVPIEEEWKNNFNLLKLFYFNTFIPFLIGNNN